MKFGSSISRTRKISNFELDNFTKVYIKTNILFIWIPKHDSHCTTYNIIIINSIIYEPKIVIYIYCNNTNKYILPIFKVDWNRNEKLKVISPQTYTEFFLFKFWLLRLNYLRQKNKLCIQGIAWTDLNNLKPSKFATSRSFLQL